MFDTLKFLKALADETRLRLALVLYRHELSVNELVALLNMGQSRVSRHLKILTDAGLLHFRRDGLWVFYSVATSGPARTCLEALLPLVYSENSSSTFHADRQNATLIIEERANKTRQFFNSIAEDWDALNQEVLGDFRLPQAVRAALAETFQDKPCNVAVDLGCGTGEVLEQLLSLCRHAIGVDGSSRMLELARRRFGEGEKVSLRIGELDHLPLRDAEADFACINLVLHHLSHPGEALTEIARVLRQGGVLMITDFDNHEVENMRHTYGDRWLGFTRQNLEYLLRQAGFQLISVQVQAVKMGLSLNLVQARKI